MASRNYSDLASEELIELLKARDRRAALEGGNTESTLRRHYLNLTTTGEAQDFWRILPPGAGEKSKVVAMTA